MKIIPAIDIIGGKCVRLTKGDYSTSHIYDNDPLEVAKQFEANGISHIHLVDLDGARLRHLVNAGTLESIAGNTNLTIDFGGGIKCDDDIQRAFNCGAAQVTVGSVAVTNEPLFLKWIETYGSEKIILAADFKNRMIAYHGWITESKIDILSFIESYKMKGVKYSICTDISRDGMLSGPSINIYRQLVTDTSIKIIASGGITSHEDLLQLADTGCDGAIIGKALYEKKITLKELSLLC